MKITYALYITFIRILLTPFIVWCILQQLWGWALMLSIGAMMTDLLDGFVARRYQQESRLGQLCDPIADKILIISVMYALLIHNVSLFMQGAGYFFIAKELLILTGAALLYYQYRIFITPTKLSRLASVLEMMTIVLLLITNYHAYHLSDVILKAVIGVSCLVSIVLLLRYGIYLVVLWWKKA